MSEYVSPWPTLPLREIASEMCLGKMLDKNKNRGLLQPYLRNVNVRWFTFDLSDLKEMRFEENETEKFSLRDGDLVICEGGEPGRAAVWRGQSEKAKIQKALHRVRFCEDEYDATFAMYFIYYGTITNYFASYYTGTTIKHLTGKALSQVRFPVPPLAEQRRIVSKIEELFSDLDAGVKSLERAKANLKRYRASVLKAAVEGRLTADWRAAHPDIEPASKSLKHNSKTRSLETLKEPSKLCFPDCVWRPIDSVIETLSQGWSPKCEQVPSDSHDTWAVIKTSAVMPMQYIEGENKKLPDKLTPREHLEVKPNDLLITRAGPRNRAAVTCLVKSTRPKLIVCDKVYRVGLRQDVVIPAYLEVVLNAPQVLKELNGMKTGISDSGVNLTQDRFRDLRIPVPSLPEQHAILELINEKFSLVEVCEKSIARSLIRSAPLRQQILKRAFEGMLCNNATCSTTENGSIAL